jgi:hypothetical protein
MYNLFFWHNTDFGSESYVTTDSQSASLSRNKERISCLRPDSYYCQTVAGLLMWRALSDERRGVVCNCCWSSPAQSFSGPNPAGLATIFHCLRFETSLFVASCVSQGHGGGIGHHLRRRLTLDNHRAPNFQISSYLRIEGFSWGGNRRWRRREDIVCYIIVCEM